MASLSFLLEDGGLTEEQMHDINAIFESASHMQRLVNDVLDLSKLRAGSLAITAEAVRQQRCVLLTAPDARFVYLSALLLYAVGKAEQRYSRACDFPCC